MTQAAAISRAVLECGAAPSPARKGVTPLERSQGQVELSFKLSRGQTHLGHLFQSGCAKVRFPAAEPGGVRQAVIINTAGGLTDGDRLKTTITWQEGTSAMVTTQAAERIYKSRGQDAVIETRLNVGAGADAFWLPQETILFDRGALCRTTDIDISPGGRLVACEGLIFGRAAMGERIDRGALKDAWRIRIGGKLVFADTFAIDGAIDAKGARAALLNGNRAQASIIIVADGPRAILEQVRAAANSAAANSAAANSAAAGSQQGLIAASLIGPVVLVRVLAPTGAVLKAGLGAVLQAIPAQRQGGGKLELPAVWSC